MVLLVGRDVVYTQRKVGQSLFSQTKSNGLNDLASPEGLRLTKPLNNHALPGDFYNCSMLFAFINSLICSC